eukprot:c32250_g1_i1.p1 GENE.c32250_g1_i1~~c32250_g1_i1.p1  ORF type:complete len:637 (+),score=114.63 c32250_g1_i1:253-1911(+)
MSATPQTPFDDDCDSPQIGEDEPWPNKDQVEMENPSSSRNLMKEPPVSSKHVALEKNETLPTVDDPAAFEAQEEPADKPLEQPDGTKTEVLPEPTNPRKCSRSGNSHDVPNPLELMDDDCGMPEPEIPCETVGNSTECEKPISEKIQLEPPEIPQAERMPPPFAIPPIVEAPPPKVAIEFVDLGITLETVSLPGDNVGQVIERAGSQFGIQSWATQLIRSASADVRPEAIFLSLDDTQQVVVYLKCISKRFRDSLIIDIPACEDLGVHRLTVKVELPAANNLAIVHVSSIDRVGDAIRAARIDINDVEEITYNGQRVALENPLEEISFLNNTVLVVYPKHPCPSQSPSVSPSPSPSVSLSPTASPTPSPTTSPTPLYPAPKVRKLGAYDVYRHCHNANGEKARPPPPEALGLDPATDPNDLSNSTINCDESEMTEPEIVEFSPPPNPSPPATPPPRPTQREPMTKDAKILVNYDKRLIPVLITPLSKGIDIFDAIKRATGQEHEYLIGLFLNRKIDHYTPLKPFGFVDDDVVRVVSPQAPGDDKNSLGGHSL